MRIGAGLALLVVLGGCKQEHEVFEQTNTDVWHQSPTDQVDILFVIDDSHSMKEEQAAVAAGFGDFIGEIEATGTDFHLGVITTSFQYDDVTRGQLIGEPTVLTAATPSYAGLFEERVQVGITGADKEKGLEAAEYALSTFMTSGPNAGFLRSDAYLLLVIVSDEDDCSDEGALGDQPATACYESKDLLVPVEAYVQSFRALKEDPSMFLIGSIVGPLASSGLCPEATPGHRYMLLTELMGGLLGNICDSNYGTVMQKLGLQASGVVESFLLSEAAKPETIVVTLLDADGIESEVPEGPANGWTYDPETYYLTFHGAAVPPRGSTISASYTVQSGG